MSDHPPAPVRDAASLLLLRPGTGPMSPLVLMGMRGAGHRFMPNHLVFPGGAVDPGDQTAPLARAPASHVMERLGVMGHALAHAAARELEEETGLHLGHPPDVSGLDYLCRAITPQGRPIRFDARFFVAEDHAVQGLLAGSGELEDLRWLGLGEALALDLAYPTRKVLEQLQTFLALSPEARLGPRLTPTMRDRAWQME